MNQDFEQAIQIALEPVTHQDRLTLCRHCGSMRHQVGEHVCRTEPLELPGMERDEKKRARSYAID